MRMLLCSLLMLLCAGAAHAGEPPTAPVLRVETGMHTAMIKRIATDRANRWLVTCSDDKTARVWELPSGRLARVLRPPLGEGNEGKLYAVALSPDGVLVACGGWTGWDWEGTASVYLFERATGRLWTRITGLPSVVNRLVFSPGGRQLAAVCWAGGLRVFQVETAGNGDITTRLVAQDPDYGEQAYGAAFSPDGRLVTTCFDGLVRLYDASFRLLHKEKAPGGRQPSGVAFSPDGARLAIGYNDTTRVDLLSGGDLSPLFSQDTREVSNGDLSKVAWSADGATLYAGGMYQTNGGYPVRIWGGQGRGISVDQPAAQSTIMDLAPLAGGGVLFGAGDPAFGAFDGAGRRVLFQAPAIADLRDNDDGFLLAAEGGAVRFGYEAWGKSPARFSLAGRSLALEAPGAHGKAPSPGAGARPAGGEGGWGVRLSPPRTTAPGLDVQGWKNTTSPTLNGKPLALEKYERSLSLAVAPDGESLILGCDWSLRRFDREGKELWQVPVPGVCWGVNVAANGEAAAAAFADGTIRWYRMKDGKELLAFFPHADRKRWALWTPSGYYDCSPGAEEFLGWHVNRGKDQEADFFPVSKFRDRYYRPDVIARVLQTRDEAEAVRLANEESNRRQQQVAVEQALPPVVRILSPSDGDTVSTPEVALRFTARTAADAPVTEVRVLVDGRPVETARTVAARPTAGADTQEVRVAVPPRDCEIAVIASNRHAASVPDVVRIRWQGAPPAQATPDVLKPRLYVLAVGISAYQDESLRLRFAAKDAADFAAAMKRQEGGLYRQVVTKVLADATRDSIIDSLQWLQDQTTSRDVAALFLSGHGVNDSHNDYYFIPANFDRERLRSTGVPWTEIKRTVENLAGKVLLFVDSCHSGNVMGGRKAITDVNGIVNELSSAENGAVVFTAATGNQVAFEDPSWSNGAFTKALVEGLDGKADLLRKGKITITTLDAWICDRVKELTRGRQTPAAAKPQTISDFPIAVAR